MAPGPTMATNTNGEKLTIRQLNGLSIIVVRISDLY